MLPTTKHHSSRQSNILSSSPAHILGYKLLNHNSIVLISWFDFLNMDEKNLQIRVLQRSMYYQVYSKVSFQATYSYDILNPMMQVDDIVQKSIYIILTSIGIHDNIHQRCKIHMKSLSLDLSSSYYRYPHQGHKFFCNIYRNSQYIKNTNND